MEKEKPYIIEVQYDPDISSITEEILQMYQKYDCSIGTILSSIGINNISLEQALHLYCTIMSQIEGDTFVQFFNETPYLENDNYTILGD